VLSQIQRHYIGCAAGWVAKMWKRVVWSVVFLVFGVSLVGAQDDAKVVIDAGNIDHLVSQTQIDFDEVPERMGAIEKGWFALSDTADYLAVTSSYNEIVVWNMQEESISSYRVRGKIEDYPLAVFDMSFSSGLSPKWLASFHMGSVEGDGDQLKTESTVAFYDLPYKQVDTAGAGGFLGVTPVQVWFDNRNLTWVEVIDDTSVSYVNQVYSPVMPASPDGEDITEKGVSPTTDPESVIRIGRIEPPLAVTVTEDGRVKRWNMEKGEVTAEVQINPEDGLPIYGALNAGGDSDLLWRDPASTALHILNFETGEDRTVVPLDGAYIPFIFLTRQSDVIIGVNIDDQPIVVAWNVATGERYDLGYYRECNRPPDMVRLSQDGTTLVIGCDTGLDVWRVTREK